MTKQLPKDIHTWLNNRGISDSVIEKYEIQFENNKVIIPIRDGKGNFLFNKYRRNPASEDGPKYQYAKGASSVLFGTNEASDKGAIVITEGEFDCMALVSRNIPAVSSTGGSGTFEEEWKDYFVGRDTYICYDNDEAGIKGAFNVQSVIPHAKIIWLPKQVGEHGDVTDFFVKLGKTTEDFLSLREEAKSYPIPADWKEAKTKKEMTAYKKTYEKIAEELKLEIRELGQKYLSHKHLDILKESYLNKLAEVNRAIKYFTVKRGDFGEDKIARAKSVPIPQFINFARDGFAKCIFHTDKKPSMYYYEKQNRVKCFSCGKLADVIDCVQQLRGVNLPEALKIILND